MGTRGGGAWVRSPAFGGHGYFAPHRDGTCGVIFSGWGSSGEVRPALKTGLARARVSVRVSVERARETNIHYETTSCSQELAERVSATSPSARVRRSAKRVFTDNHLALMTVFTRPPLSATIRE